MLAFMPLPNADHSPVARLQAAMLFVRTVPASVKLPASTSSGGSGPEPSGSHIVVAETLPGSWPRLTPGMPMPGWTCSVHCCAVADAAARATATKVANGTAADGRCCIGDAPLGKSPDAEGQASADA